MKTLIDLFNTFENIDNHAIVYRTGIRRFVFSYRQLYQYSLQTATLLDEYGVKQGDRVAIWAPNSPWWVIVYFACVVKGAVIVPIDFISGKENAERIVKQAKPKVLFQSTYLLNKIQNEKNILIEDVQFIIRNKKEFKPITVKQHDLLELVYTSGTTSEPKGVMLTHENIVSNIQQVNEHLTIPHGVAVLSILPLSHMFEQTIGLLCPLYLHGTVIYIRTIKPSALLSALQEEHINVLVSVPRVLQALKNTVERELETKGLTAMFTRAQSIAKGKFLKQIVFYPIRRKFGNRFLFFVSGGSALDGDVAAFWNNLGFIVVEGYGLTETSPVLSANTTKEQIIGSVGKPLPDIKIEFKDNEILAKGPNVFSGYWHNESATNDAFTKDGWFKTGDEGAVDDNGNLYIKGRKKDIIVTGAGLNVYPEDIERVLNSLPGVKESCVIGFQGIEGEEVHAVLILNKKVHPQEIIAAANKKLDEYQQIKAFHVWDDTEFPKTTTLKVQKFKVKQTLDNKNKKTALSFGHDSLINLLVKVSGKRPNEIKETSLLNKDLGITSIGRLELASDLEQEYRIDIDDSLINQYTSVMDIRQIIQNKTVAKNEIYLPTWQFNFFAQVFRRIMDLAHYAMYYAIATTDVEGLENLRQVKQPAIIIQNHVSYIDAPFALVSIPGTWRYNTTIAAREEFFKIKKGSPLLKGFLKFALGYTTLCWNLFLLPQYRGFRNTFSYMGKMVDEGHNILIYPEGERTKDGNLLPFYPGLGLIVKELQVPVIPINTRGLEKIFPRGAKMPKRGKAKVVIGKPLYFTTETPSEIVKIARNALIEL